jgi:hypothetical protein
MAGEGNLCVRQRRIRKVIMGKCVLGMCLSLRMFTFPQVRQMRSDLEGAVSFLLCMFGSDSHMVPSRIERIDLLGEYRGLDDKRTRGRGIDWSLDYMIDCISHPPHGEGDHDHRYVDLKLKHFVKGHDYRWHYLCLVT